MFFIAEFADNMRAKTLYYVLKEHGEIDEVVIPPNIDKRGKKYGFVYFFQCEIWKNIIGKTW